MNERGRNLRDAFPAPDARFHAATLRALGQIRAKQSRRATFSPRRALLAAAILLAALTATGALQGVFASIGSRWSDPPTSDYAHLDEAAARDVFEQALTFDNGARATLRLEQSYYNGAQLALVWSLQPEGDFAWFYESSDARYADVRPTQELPPDGTMAAADVDLCERIGAERADEFYRRLDANGWAGVAWYDCYLGDHIEFPGAPGDFSGDAGAAAPDPYDQGHWRQDASDCLYMEFDALPDGARDRDVLPVNIRAYARLTWYCQDESGGYWGESDIEAVRADARSATAEVPRCEDFRSRDYQFTAAFPMCGVEIELRATPIHVKFAWESQLPEEWRTVRSDPANFPDDALPAALPEDAFYRCEFYAEGNGGQTRLPIYDQSDELPLRCAGSFVFPEGATAIRVRPVYRNSGEHPEEEVRFELN